MAANHASSVHDSLERIDAVDSKISDGRRFMRPGRATGMIVSAAESVISDEATAETYSMVGRSQPLTLLSDWEKYHLR